MASGIGVVVIGRNEGQRLERCLRSLQGTDKVMYVDSGSTDGSPHLARSPAARQAAANSRASDRSATIGAMTSR